MAPRGFSKLNLSLSLSWAAASAMTYTLISNIASQPTAIPVVYSNYLMFCRMKPWVASGTHLR